MKIYKYPLPPKRGTFKLEAHPIRKILHVQVVRVLFPYFWAEVDDEKEQISYDIHSFHTGEAGVPWHEFIGTCVLDNGDYVLHYYLEKKS